MLEYMVILLVAMATMSLPAWYAAKRRNQATAWLLTGGIPALCVWFLLAGTGIGPQSLSNLAIETGILAILSVVSAYIQPFLLNRRFANHRRTAAFCAAGLVVAAIVLRLAMPVLPE